MDAYNLHSVDAYNIHSTNAYSIHSMDAYNLHSVDAYNIHSTNAYSIHSMDAYNLHSVDAYSVLRHTAYIQHRQHTAYIDHSSRVLSTPLRADCHLHSARQIESEKTSMRHDSKMEEMRRLRAELAELTHIEATVQKVRQVCPYTHNKVIPMSAICAFAVRSEQLCARLCTRLLNLTAVLNDSL